MLDYRFVDTSKVLLVCCRHVGQTSHIKVCGDAVHSGGNVRSAVVALGIEVVVAADFGAMPSCFCPAV